jgi:N-acetylmuramoyl-L-alanine amidase
LLAGVLRKRGYTVLTDGEPGVNRPLADAVRLVPQGKLAAIELHCNAGPSSATGVETISLPRHRPLAQALSQAVAGALGLRVRGDGGWVDQSQSARGRLAFVEAGGLIIELFFLSSREDRRRWDDNRVDALAALADVLDRRAM